jgi:hypothetical protein
MWNHKIRTKYLAVVLFALAGKPGGLDIHTRKARPNLAAKASPGSFATAGHRPSGPPAISGIAARARSADAYGKLPLGFEVNEGQSGQVDFLSRGRGYTLFLTSSEAVLALKKVSNPSAKSVTLRMHFLGTNSAAAATAMEQLPGAVNYFIGNDPRKWRTNIRTYGKVRYRDIYSGVDLIYYGNQQQLEYDVVVNPGADPAAARLGFSGAGTIRLDADGDLVLSVSKETVRLRKPVAYQKSADGRQPIEAHYTMHGRDQVTFAVAPYDHTKPLVIDPVLVYSSYFGGSATELIEGNNPGFFSGIAVDAAGSAYVSGTTASADFPTVNPIQGAFGGGSTDAFVTKFTADGSALVYSTYVGGSSTDWGGAIALDSLGNAYITGQTASSDFPTTQTAYQPKIPGEVSAFVTKLNASGSALVYSTYLGGSLSDSGVGIAVDSSGRASITGQANSTNFPVTQNAPQTTCHGAPDAFVTTLTADGTALVFSTFLGGRSEDVGNGIALDSSGNIYVVGLTTSTDFPIVNALQTALAGSWNAFIAKFNPDTSTMIYSTFLGGSAFDEGLGIAVDSSGSAYIIGFTESSDFPTKNPFQATLPGAAFETKAAFVSKLNPSGSALVYSTFLGGGDSVTNDGDFALGIAVDSTGSAYVTGSTNSGNFPSVNALQPYKGNAPFLAKFTPDGSTLAYSTFFAGLGMGSAIAVDTSNNAYVTGTTNSPNFVTTPGALQRAFAGVQDGWLVKISGDTTLTTAASSQTPSVYGQQVTFTVTVTASVSNANVPTGTVTFKDGTVPLGTATLTNGTAKFSIGTLIVGDHSILITYGGDSYFGPSAATVGQDVTTAFTTATLTASPNPAAVGQTVTFTATIAPISPGAGNPPGTVSFLEGTATIGIGALNSGVATFADSTLGAGSYTISVFYGGMTASYGASVSDGLTLVVASGATNVLVPESVTVSDAYTFVLNPCDIQQNNRFSLTDVQTIVNQALGVSPPANDVTGDGAVNILDIEVEVNAVLGLGCVLAQ